MSINPSSIRITVLRNPPPDTRSRSQSSCQPDDENCGFIPQENRSLLLRSHWLKLDHMTKIFMIHPALLPIQVGTLHAKPFSLEGRIEEWVPGEPAMRSTRWSQELRGRYPLLLKRAPDMLQVSQTSGGESGICSIFFCVLVGKRQEGRSWQAWASGLCLTWTGF